MSSPSTGKPAAARCKRIWWRLASVPWIERWQRKVECNLALAAEKKEKQAEKSLPKSDLHHVNVYFLEIEEKERSYYPLQLRQLFKGQFTKCCSQPIKTQAIKTWGTQPTSHKFQLQKRCRKLRPSTFSTLWPKAAFHHFRQGLSLSRIPTTRILQHISTRQNLFSSFIIGGHPPGEASKRACCGKHPKIKTYKLWVSYQISRYWHAVQWEPSKPIL